MRNWRVAACLAAVVSVAGAAWVSGSVESDAAAVTVRNVHLCCGGCDAAVEEALLDVEGVSEIAVDRDSNLVRFYAADAKAAQAGIAALAGAGFHGRAAHGDRELAFPVSGARRGERRDTFTLAGVHLCCNACVTAVQESLQDVQGLSSLDIDRQERTVKLNGRNIDVPAAVAALNAAGFHGTVAR